MEWNSKKTEGHITLLKIKMILDLNIHVPITTHI